jgi:hypothetical protein
LNVALVGDFAQLPPVGDTPLYAPPSNAASKNGNLSRDGGALYRLFTLSFRLQIVHRQGGDSPDQLVFRNLLSHASRGELTQEEWRLLVSRSERNLIGMRAVRSTGTAVQLYGHVMGTVGPSIVRSLCFADP